YYYKTQANMKSILCQNLGRQCKSTAFFIYPAICRAVRPPPQNSAKVKKLGGGSIARKGPIGEG
ncbi:hypothetical protein P4391_30135, partial [Bacillus thuringiensis]|nr:hypothetical protein [Bacillus thuringiensis]